MIPHIKKIFFSITVILFLLPTLQAKEQHPIEIQLAVTSIGYGLHGGYHVNPYIFGGLDSTSLKFESKGTRTDTELVFSTNVPHVRFSPFSGSFYGQLGYAFRDWKVDGVSRDSAGNEKYTITLKFPSTALNVGLGWNWVGNSGFSGGFGFQYLSGGNPELEGKDITGNNQAELDEELKKSEDDFKRFATILYINLNIGWNF